MKLFYSPGTCSLGIHIILEEIGTPYETSLVNLREGEQFSADFRQVNPKGKVPALLRDDGSVLTEFPAIAFWLAQSFPAAGLISNDSNGQARALELIDFVVATVHMRGFTLAMLPQKFIDDPEAQIQLKQTGQKVATEGLATLSGLLGDKEWFLGRYSIADAAVFYTLNWALRDKVALADNLAAFHARMLARPPVQAALWQEG